MYGGRAFVHVRGSTSPVWCAHEEQDGAQGQACHEEEQDGAQGQGVLRRSTSPPRHNEASA